MFVVWKGWGILTVLIVVIVAGAVTMALSVALAAAGLTDTLELAAIAIGLFAAAVANWYAGKHFNDVPGRELVDPKTGQTVVLKPRHDLFFIKMEYWSIPVAIAGVLVLLGYFVG
ncbi:MAG: hypothetical protein M9924_21810 [Rhizobiaceae bacterium]|nr:hypothetical protein [Rhizobiaceae bacterium]